MKSKVNKNKMNKYLYWTQKENKNHQYQEWKTPTDFKRITNNCVHKYDSLEEIDQLLERQTIKIQWRRNS